MARREDRRHDRELEPLPPRDPILGVIPGVAGPGPLPSDVGVAAPRDPTPERRPLTPRRRRLLAAAVVVVALVVAGALAQGAFDRREARRAAVAFDTFEGADYLLSQQTSAVDNQMVPDDEPAVDAVLARAELSRAAALTKELDGLHTSVWYDGATRHLVTAVRVALRARIADLDALAAWRAQPATTRGSQPADPSPAAKAAVDRALVLAAAHVVRPPSSGPPPFVTEDLVSSLQLTNWSDVSTGSTLAVADAAGVALVNVDASTAIDLNLAGTIQPVVAREGYVAAVTADGSVLAKAPTLGAPVTMIGEAGEILPATRPDAVWLVDSSVDTASGGPTTTVTEVDGTSRRLVGAVLVPRGEYVTGGVTDEGLVLSVGAAGLSVWDPATGRGRIVTSGDAVLLAASGHLLAWQAGNERVVHVTDLTTGANRVIALTGDNLIVAEPDVSASTCAFAPDGGRLACPILTLPSRQNPPGGPPEGVSLFHLGVIDLSTDTLTVLAGAAGRAGAHPMVWAPDGSRLWSVVSTTEGSLLATWSPGQATAKELRYRVGHWMVGVAVVDQHT